MTFGAGCAGSPRAARRVPENPPRLGHTLELRLFGLPQDLAVALTRFGNRVSSLGTLAIDPGFPGIQGRALRASFEILSSVGGTTDRAAFAITLPNDFDLIRPSIFRHALVCDTAANPFGAALSEASATSIGR